MVFYLTGVDRKARLSASHVQPSATQCMTRSLTTIAGGNSVRTLSRFCESVIVCAKYSKGRGASPAFLFCATTDANSLPCAINHNDLATSQCLPLLPLPLFPLPLLPLSSPSSLSPFFPPDL